MIIYKNFGSWPSNRMAFDLDRDVGILNQVDIPAKQM